MTMRDGRWTSSPIRAGQNLHQLSRIDVRPAQNHGRALTLQVDLLRDDRRGTCCGGAFDDEVFVPDDVGDAAAERGFADDNDAVDDRANEVEGDGVGIEVAREAVRERRRDVDVNEAAGFEAAR